ncbi:Ca2+ regulator and membrane fusion Fig1 [Pyrenophora seminiperda CCB06]|uniref:Ca2+ regulator and membrane fusion Fig1 n=1 Tax=Pyrenophora seminiperda CCB06 TaxID=1302712 RepID=A0A3M7M2C6_9PLEO|nr:Ca2+ regulator and membrane fusion Fig1 [Pyrenophora seminiperda CCB06]
MFPLFMLTFLKHRILSKTIFISFLTFIALVIYLFTLLGCISKGAGIENLYWVRITQSGTAGQPPVEVRIGYFGLCASFPPNTKASTSNPIPAPLECFPSDSPPGLSDIPMSHPVLASALILQKSSFIPLPALAAPMYLVSLIYYSIYHGRGGRNEKVSKILLAISAALGVAGALCAMTSAKALHEMGILLGHQAVGGGEGEVGVQAGSWEGAALCVAAGIHLFVASFAACGMPGFRSY